ncbi:hypothetical protein, partial [Acinetobacter baumannii]|uniref:hypothetical protein n=1 Tax=Acinetobacter baumannii TaxID=470 RepID=UPI001CB7D86D
LSIKGKLLCRRSTVNSGQVLPSQSGKVTLLGTVSPFKVSSTGFGSTITDIEVRDGYNHADIREKVGELAWASFEESLELVQMA